MGLRHLMAAFTPRVMLPHTPLPHTIRRPGPATLPDTDLRSAIAPTELVSADMGTDVARAHLADAPPAVAATVPVATAPTAIVQTETALLETAVQVMPRPSATGRLQSPPARSLRSTTHQRQTHPSTLAEIRR